MTTQPDPHAAPVPALYELAMSGDYQLAQAEEALASNNVMLAVAHIGAARAWFAAVAHMSTRVN